jgi:hypothetical protein
MPFYHYDVVYYASEVRKFESNTELLFGSLYFNRVILYLRGISAQESSSELSINDIT